MTSTRRFLPRRRVVVVPPPEGSLLSVVGPLEALDVANRILARAARPPLYDIVLAGLTAEVGSSAGPALVARPLAEIDALHTLLVGGGPELPERPVDPALLAEVDRLAGRAERLVSVCAGAFVLGELGRLDGRRCTTHWLWLDELRRRFPAARVEPDAIYTEDGPVWTSAGVSTGIDLALQIILGDGGPRLAQAVARTLVVFVHRPGGQSQFSAALTLRPGLDERFRALVARIVAEPGAEHGVEALAGRVAMSPRHFARVFRARTGETPAAFVARVRVEAAQRALCGSDATVAQIASDCGFGTEETMRRTFQRVLGVTPRAYRERFATSGAAP